MDDSRALVEVSLREAGLLSFGFVGKSVLLSVCSSLPPTLRSRLGIEDSGVAVAVALAYGEGLAAAGQVPRSLWTALGPGRLAKIARFARADWYGELCSRLRDAIARARSRLSERGLDPGASREWRYFANSRLPERSLALKAGLGRLGRNGLVIAPGPGSAMVLGLLLIPQQASRNLLEESGDERGVSAEALDPLCSGCRACVAACPTGALRGDGSLARELCLQHWSSIPGALPPAIEAAWGARLYGCDACQEACPRFRPDPRAATSRGFLGEGLPASWLVAATEYEIRAFLRGSALGMKWIAVEALKRSAALALRER